jgi:hypothetical protein
LARGYPALQRFDFGMIGLGLPPIAHGLHPIYRSRSSFGGACRSWSWDCRERPDMIESIAGIGAVTAFTPSAQGGIERRRKRLNWLSSLRTALGEAGPLVDEIVPNGAEAATARAQIADALGVVEELRARIGSTQSEPDEPATGRTITATELARRIAASADRSLAAQAHVGAEAVRRYVGGPA